MRDYWGFAIAGQVRFGSGVHRRVGALARELGAEAVLLTTDRNLAKAGLLDMLLGPLQEAGLKVHIFDGGEAEPAIRVVEKCLLEMEGREFQAVVGLGGGSNMDLAKAVALIRSHGGQPADYFGEGKVPGPIMPVIAIPTTAGTGSEVSPGAVLTDEAADLKVSISSPHLRPRLALVDPLLTLSCPPRVTAHSGMDALAHAIEAFTAIEYRYVQMPSEAEPSYWGKNPLGDILALEAIRLIGRWLRLAVFQGNNLAAREGMALASLLAGMSFSNAGVAAVHALQYPVGAATHSSHGEGNALLLPHVMEFNNPTRLAEHAQIARALGEDTEGLSPEEAAARGIEAVRKLSREAGIRQSLRELGVKREDLPQMAQKAAGVERLMRIQPRAMSTEAALSILERAY